MWPALRCGLNNNKNLKELLNKIKEMMFCPGYKRVQRCSVLVAEGFNWVVGQQLLSPSGRTQHAIGSYTVKTQHPHGSCTRQDLEGCGSSTRQDPTWNGVLHCAGPEANGVLHLARPKVIVGPALHLIRLGPASCSTQSAGSNTQLGPAHVRT